jgi:hypothetical protein
MGWDGKGVGWPMGDGKKRKEKISKFSCLSIPLLPTSFEESVNDPESEDGLRRLRVSFASTKIFLPR